MLIYLFFLLNSLLQLNYLSRQNLVNSKVLTIISAQVGTTANDNGADNSFDKKASYCSQESVHDESVKFSGPSIVTNGSLQVKVSDCKSHKKSKKIKLRRQVPSLTFRSSMLLKASLGIRKKKKHKKSKLRSLDTKSLSKELLMDKNCFPSDLGPSTSEKTNTILLASTHSPRKEAKSFSRTEANGNATKDGNSYGESLENVVDGEFRDRIGQNGTVLATDEQLQNHSSFRPSMNHQPSARENGSPPSQDHKRERVQNGWMGMLTRGLEETVGKCFIWKLFSVATFFIC